MRQHEETHTEKERTILAPLSETDFDQTIKEGNVLILFSAGWCPHCRAMRPVLEEVAAEHPALRLYILDADHAPGLTARFRIRSLPQTILFHDGVEVDRLIGFRKKQEVETLLIASPVPV